jgi:hypothetical protein
VRILSNGKRESIKQSPYIKNINRQSLNVTRDRTKTHLQRSNKIMRHIFNDNS